MCVLPTGSVPSPSSLWRLQCARVLGQRGNRAALCVFHTLWGVSLPAGSFQYVFLGLDVSSSSRRPVCLMCHRNVYSEGGVPWYKLWSGQACRDPAEAMTEHSVENITQILWARYLLPFCIPRGFNANLWNAVRNSLPCMLKKATLLKLGEKDDLKHLQRIDWHQTSLYCTFGRDNFSFCLETFMCLAAYCVRVNNQIMPHSLVGFHPNAFLKKSC